MLDFIYYPVSFILWCWHWVFGHLLGPSNGIGWALSVVFLVFTIRLVLSGLCATAGPAVLDSPHGRGGGGTPTRQHSPEPESRSSFFSPVYGACPRSGSRPAVDGGFVGGTIRF